MRLRRPSARSGPALSLLAFLAIAAFVTRPAGAQEPSKTAPAGAPSPEAPGPPPDPRTLTFPPLSISFPKPEKILLPNGLLVYLFEDHELPLLDAVLYFKAGAIFEPADKAGLASLTATMMRVGGTEESTPDEVDEALEFRAAHVGLEAGDDMLSASVSAVKDKFPDALRLLAAMLRAPRFDPARLEVERARAFEELRRRWDDPGTIAELNFRRLVYGASSPWGRLADADSIGRIRREDLVAFQRTYIHPNNSVMGVAGDFEPRAMKKLLEETFRKWPQAKVTPPAVPKIKDEVPVGVHLVARPFSQSNVEIGHLGAGRFDPDKFAIKILNFILGEGGFTSRLVKEVRSNRGLAYSVGGGIGLDSDRGLFQISCSTKASSTVETIDVVRKILKDFIDQGPTEQEVKEAKEASINSFVFSVEGTVSFMQAFLYYDFYNYPPGFLQTYRDNLAKVTREQVLQTARKRIHPDRLVVFVVGDDKTFDRPLQSLGLGEPRAVKLDSEPAAGSGAP
ncbi:MAG TPA: pitrilysin family protein [Candidatus Polarisedimenticolia bacterium]|nr:pitrilysin family protein [Candidatus Polarisedimenticolia bacterium]